MDLLCATRPTSRTTASALPASVARRRGDARRRGRGASARVRQPRPGARSSSRPPTATRSRRRSARARRSPLGARRLGLTPSTRRARRSTRTSRGDLAGAAVEGRRERTRSSRSARRGSARVRSSCARRRVVVAALGAAKWRRLRTTYKVLGVDRRIAGGRDQEGVPQACAQVAPRPELRQRGGRGEVQGDPGGLRHRRRPGEAQAVRPAAAGSASRGGGGRRRRLRRLPTSATRDASATSLDLFGGMSGAAAGGGRAARRARPRSRGSTVSIGFDQSINGTEVPRSVTRAEPATPATAPAPPGHDAEDLPALRRPRRRDRRPGHVLDLASRARSAAARAPSSTSRARPATASGTRADAQVPREDSAPASATARASAWPARASRVTTAARRRPVRDHPRRPTRRSSTAQGRQPRGGRAGHDRRGASAARRSRCRRSNGTKSIKVPAGHQAGTVIRLRGEGPAHAKGGGHGDLHYRIEVEVPRQLNEEQRRLETLSSDGRTTWRGSAHDGDTRASRCFAGARGGDGDERLRERADSGST